LPWTILRATQFHNLLDFALRAVVKRLGWSPLLLLPTDFQFQLIDAGETADVVVQHITQPGGLLPDLGGPEVLTLGEIARTWLRAREMSQPVWRLPLPGKVAAGFRAGYNTCPSNRHGRITWADWVAWRRRHYQMDYAHHPQIFELPSLTDLPQEV
jgi:uncharacterized protein YbjT (DUF2867 family)